MDHLYLDTGNYNMLLLPFITAQKGQGKWFIWTWKSVITLPIILFYICLTCQDKSYPYIVKKRACRNLMHYRKVFLGELELLWSANGMIPSTKIHSHKVRCSGGGGGFLASSSQDNILNASLGKENATCKFLCPQKKKDKLRKYTISLKYL